MFSSKNLLMLLLAFSSAAAFAPMSQPRVARPTTTTQIDAVTEVGSEDAFDKTISSAGDSLVIVDYSTVSCLLEVAGSMKSGGSDGSSDQLP